MEDRGILRRIKDNDPGLVELTIGRRGDYFPSDGDWGGLGNDIAKNTSLETLNIDTYPYDDDKVTHADLVVFFGAISTNTSLRDIDLSFFTSLGEEELRSLAPMFKSNKSIERSEICRKLPCLPLLASALTEANSLKAFDLHVNGCDEHVERGEKIITSLSNHHGLEELILRNVQIRRDGCALLADMLLNRQSKLAVLDLSASKKINNELASILAIGLAGNIALGDLSLKLFPPSKKSEEAWEFFLALKSPSSKLDMLLDDTNATTVAGIHLFGALENNGTLKALKLHLNRNIAMASWCALSEYLQSPRCLLEEIELNCVNISDESIECFSNSMAINRTVKTLVLSLSGNTTITRAGWVAFSTALQNPGSALESLDLSGNELIDEGAFELICNGISSNNKLKELVIRFIENVPSEGWRISVPHLLNTNTSLEKLDLRCNPDIDHDTLISFIPALAENVNLKEFLMDEASAWYMEHDEDPDFMGDLDTDSWASMLCNGSSIRGTYESNHTLQRLMEEWDGVVPDVIESLLHINRNNSKSQAARLKIAQAHFGGGFIAPPFNGMGVKFLPHALAWMSRAVGMNDVDGHFYGFVKDCLFQKVGNPNADQGSGGCDSLQIVAGSWKRPRHL